MAAVPKEIQKLSRFLTYVLGRQPDEFGLIPDDQGFIAINELLKALHQEAGWRHVRMPHLHQLIAMKRPAPIQIEGSAVRATDRSQLPAITPPINLPKLLYTAIRRRAYPAALEKGLDAGNRPFLILSSDRTMAQKIGQRLDNHPVILTVQVVRSQTKGTNYHQFGETLYLADTIAADTFTGPALPKEKAPSDPKMPETEVKEAKTPGSYFPDVTTTPEEKKALKRERRQRKIAQEKERRQARKHKSRRRI